MEYPITKRAIKLTYLFLFCLLLFSACGQQRTPQFPIETIPDIHPDIVLVHNFSDGLALVCTTEMQYGYINTRGEMQIKPMYDMAFDFSEGLAIVGTSNTSGQITWSAINKEGEMKFHLPLTDSRISESYSCGLLTYRNIKLGYCGAIDKNGKSVFRLPDTVEHLLPYEHNAAICFTANGVGLVNPSGKIIIPPNYWDGKIVGRNRVALKWKDKWGIFNFQGKPITGFVYDDISDIVKPEDDFKQQDKLLFLRTNQDTITIEEVKETTVAQPAGQPTQASVSKQTRTNLNQISLVREISKSSPFYEESQRIISAGLSEDDAQNRHLILDYVEHFRRVYITKNIDFLNQLFSEKALIIVGKVVKEAPRHELNLLSQAQVVYNIRSKKEYLTRLKAVFNANQTIEVQFEDFKIMRHPTREGIYGVSLKQGYQSDLYSDEGFLFLLWDFRDKQAPTIHVRTWQPSMLEPGIPLPAEDIFNLRNFNLQ